MPDLFLSSSLTDDEIAENFKSIDFFSGIMSGLEEALAYEKGHAKAATIVRKRSLPEVDPCVIRKAMNMTQKEFASVLGVSTRTVESWEAGRSTPTPTARNLMFLIHRNPELVSQLKR
jgi:putative transcriptional regulator